MSYLTPRSMEAAFAALGTAGATVVAGGTDWYPALGERLPSGDVLDITALPGLRGITTGARVIRIGAATPWSDLIAADLPPAFDGLKAAGREVGSVQIQNAGTIGGNLCNASPAADGVPPLLTLGARVELGSASGCRDLALADFILGPRRTALRPGELLAAVLIPQPGHGARGAFLKAGARRYMVISIASAAAVLRLDQGRIVAAMVAVGSCSAVPQRLVALEAALVGCAASALPAITPEHLASLSPIADVRGSAAYRLRLVGVLVARVLQAAAGPGPADHG